MKKKGRIAFELLIFVVVMYYWLRMVFVRQEGQLTSMGLGSLKYFTVLSNLLEGFASLAFAVGLCLKEEADRKFHVWKYVAAVEVTLTFVTVMVFLGPLFGYRLMFMGSNLILHLIVPLAALFEFVFLNREKMGRNETLLADGLMILYGTFYLGNIAINGIGQWPKTNDWYGFMTWGIPGVIIIFAVMIGGVYLIGFLLRKWNEAVLKRRAIQKQSGR